MSQADDIVKAAADVDAATRAAELATDLVEHEGEATVFTFEDDSVLVVLDERLSVYADIDAARKALQL
jgi:predicted oxidoreductase (fatty acid repression mutant protein)